MTREQLERAFYTMSLAKAMTETYEDNFKQVSKYVHATSRGHEAIQVALGMQLHAVDYVYPYYRDDAMLLGIGMQPYDLMLQLMAKRDDPFSGGRTYYSHPSLNDPDKPKIPHQSSATGMQAIPATGTAMGMQYLELIQEGPKGKNLPLTVCSLGDASITEGEVSEAFQVADHKQLPILYLIQDNEWDISAKAEEIRSQDAHEFARGFKGLEAISIDGTDFESCYNTVKKIMATIRKERRPFLLHAKVPLLNHHTSGVRKEWYRDDLADDQKDDPYPKLKALLKDNGFTTKDLERIQSEALNHVLRDFKRASEAEDPRPEDLFTHDLAPTPITDESGQRSPANGEKVVMVDCALHAIDELLASDNRCLLYGQDVGERLGGVFREAATLGTKYGKHRVFNTAIQEAFIVGSTVGMSAVGLKPIVEVQFADYIWPGLNQLFSEVSRSYYLSNGKYPVSMILRVPIGAYGSGGPYHSSSVESVVSNIRGIKIAYPSNGADLKGLLKAAYYDPNPVVVFEHKGLYWSKVKGTEDATSIEPDEDYVIPFGQARLEQEIWPQDTEEVLSVITYGMGVHWAKNASRDLGLEARVEILDLRTLYPLDEAAILRSVKKTHKCLIVTEEPKSNSFSQALAGRIQEQAFKFLDAPIMVVGSEDLPAIPLNNVLERTMIPSSEKVQEAMMNLLNY